LYCLPSHFLSAKSPPQLRDLSHSETSFSVPCWKMSVSSFISHPAIKLATLRSTLILLSPRLCFTLGSHNQLRATNSPDVIITSACYSLKKIYVINTNFLKEPPASLYCNVLSYTSIRTSLECHRWHCCKTKIRNGDTTDKHRRRFEADVKIYVNEIYRPMWKNSMRV